MPTLAPKLPWQHPFAGGYPGRGGQPLPTDADAIDYLNRLAAVDGAAVEVGIAQAIDAFVRGCKADSAGYAGDPTRSNWDAIQASCIMCGARTLSGALVPLKGTAPTPYNFASGDYSRSGATPGLKGNGSTKYLDTNRAGNADGQDDYHLSAYQTAAAGGVAALIGSTVTSPESRTSLVTAGADYYPRINNSTGALANYPGGNTVGLFAASRALAASYVARSGTSENFPLAVASTAHQAQSVYVFSQNVNGSPADFSGSRLAFYSIGSSLSLSALDARVSTLVSQIAAAIP